jgi:RIO kinase 1
MLTYRPSRHEEGWLLESFDEWLHDDTLTDVLYRVRGGKEATVYCCRGGPNLDHRLVAAKVYRPRQFRELRNDAVYREGRALFDGEGHAIRRRDRRMEHAMRKGTRHGKRVAHLSWVTHEQVALETLFAAGGAVPEPFVASANAVLMEFVGDEQGAAPSLDRVRLPEEQARVFLAEALRNVELMLAHGMVHGDLSPYNLLSWRDKMYVIDLPQVCDVFGNPLGVSLFLRDVERVCDGFGRSGVAVDAREIADQIWDRVFGTEGGLPDVPITAPAPLELLRA